MSKDIGTLPGRTIYQQKIPKFIDSPAGSIRSDAAALEAVNK
jgi:hypothetical protein